MNEEDRVRANEAKLLALNTHEELLATTHVLADATADYVDTWKAYVDSLEPGVDPEVRIAAASAFLRAAEKESEAAALYVDVQKRAHSASIRARIALMGHPNPERVRLDLREEIARARRTFYALGE